MEWVDGHIRLTIALFFLACCGILVFLGCYAAVIFFIWLPIGTIYYSIVEPDSVVALQQDQRDRQARSNEKDFISCLATGGIEPYEEEQFECVSIDPVSFVYYPAQYGSTQERLDRIVQLSSPLFKAKRTELEHMPANEEGYLGYRITYYGETEIETLTAMKVDFNDLEEEPTRERIPIGKYSNGETAFITLDGCVGGMVQGQSRSGKSCACSTIAAMISRLPNERLIVCSNKIQDYQNYRGRVELYDDPQDILNLIRSLNAEAERRKQYCLDRGLKKVTNFGYDPDYGDISHITLIVDEYAVLRVSVVEDPETGKQVKVGDAINAALEVFACRNAAYGMNLFILCQKFHSNLISTTTRSQLTSNLIGFSSGDSRSDEMLFDTRADEARSCEIPISSKGVGYLFCEGIMDKPRLFRAAYIDEKTEKEVASQTMNLKPCKNLTGVRDERNQRTISIPT